MFFRNLDFNLLYNSMNYRKERTIKYNCTIIFIVLSNPYPIWLHPLINNGFGFILFNYTQLIISGPGAALTAKIDKSNTVRTTNITMQFLKSILRLWKFIGSAMLFLLLKSQVVLVCFIIFSPQF